MQENDPIIAELRELQQQVRQASQQAKVYESSLLLVSKTVRKNQLTIKQLEAIPSDRNVYVPLGRAFLKRSKDETIKQIAAANEKLSENSKDLEKNLKYYAQKTNEKNKIYVQTFERAKKKFQQG